MAKAKDEDFFELDHSTLDGLIDRGFLKAKDRNNSDALQEAMQKFFAATFGGKASAGQPTSPRPPSVSVPKTKPMSQVQTSPSAQQLLDEIVTLEMLIEDVRIGVRPVDSALRIFEKAYNRLKAMNAYPASILSAQFNRDLLAWELQQAGLL